MTSFDGFSRVPPKILACDTRFQGQPRADPFVDYSLLFLCVLLFGENYIIMPRNVIDDTYLGKLIDLVEEHPALYRQTDRYFIDRNKSHYRLICHSNKRDICTCIYKNVSLLKSYESIYIV